MHINHGEERRLSYLQTRSLSVDIIFVDKEVINKANIYTALEEVKEDKQKFEEWQKSLQVSEYKR